MKLKTIQQRLGTFLRAEQRAQAKEKAAIKELLVKLKRKEHHLRDKLAASETTEQREKIETKLAVCHAQREKGVALLRQIKSNA
jgi:hypothetical protein